MSSNVYRQQLVTATYNGVPLIGMGDGASVTFTYVGGEVAITEGTDGGDINLATDQGMTIDITLRETSPVHEYLWRQHRSQGLGGPGATLVMLTGTGRTLIAPNCFVSMPGELQTGDKQQGSHTYTFTSVSPNFY